MKKTLYFSFLVIVWVVILFPQDVIWKNLKQNLTKNQIELSVKEVNMNLYLLYNKVNLTSLTLFNTIHVDRLNMSYTLLNPMKIKLNGEFENEPFEGEINLLNKNGFVLLKNNSLKNSLLRSYFKKDLKGLKYEFTY